MFELNKTEEIRAIYGENITWNNKKSSDGIDARDFASMEKQKLMFLFFFCCVWVLQGDLEEALKKFQALIDENPRDFRPYLCQVSQIATSIHYLFFQYKSPLEIFSVPSSF